MDRVICDKSTLSGGRQSAEEKTLGALMTSDVDALKTKMIIIKWHAVYAYIVVVRLFAFLQ